jgi:hypothetical protein
MAVASRLSELELPICDEALFEQIRKGCEAVRKVLALNVIDESQHMFHDQQVALNKLKAWLAENER